MSPGKEPFCWLFRILIRGEQVLMKFAFVLIALFATCPASADELLVLARQSFLNHWKEEGAGIAHLEVGGRRQPLYGCINVGFVVEADGSVSGPARLLLYRFDRPLPAGPNILDWITGIAPEALPKFAPIDAKTAPVATYTSWPIALRSDKLARQLRGRNADKLDAALQEGCEVDDLLRRIQDRDATPEERDPLPGLDDLAPRQ